MNNIEEMANQEPKLYKRVYFIKPYDKKPKIKFDENREQPKMARVEYKHPPQIKFDFEGTVKVWADEPQVMLGIVYQAQQQEIWKELFDELQKYSDGYIKDDMTIDVGDYIWYLKDFDNREDVIGNIKRKIQVWQVHLDWIEDRLEGEVDKRGDDQIKEKVKVG